MLECVCVSTCVCGKSYYNLIALSNPFRVVKRERGNKLELNFHFYFQARTQHPVCCCCICIFIFWWWRIAVALGCDNKLHTNFNFHAQRSAFNSGQCIIPGANRRNSCSERVNRQGRSKWGWEWVCSAARDAHGNKGLKKLVACMSLTDDAAR